MIENGFDEIEKQMKCSCMADQPTCDFCIEQECKNNEKNIENKDINDEGALK